jgi:hypothetical protein
MYFEQPIVIFDTTEALSPTTGSFVLYGGLSINATYQSNNASTGAFVIAGGIGINKKLNVGGDSSIAGIVTITNTTESTGTGSGALVVSGGVGIASDLNVGGDATITGNLYVNGTTTTVNSSTIDIDDNTILLNAGPAGSRDAGIVIQRAGVDVTSETAFTSGTLAGITAGNYVIQLDATHTQDDDYYRGWWIKTDDGIAQITGYTSSSNLASLATAGNSLGETSANLEFQLYNRSYLAQYFDETAKMVTIAYLGDVTDPKTSLINNGQYADLRSRALYAVDSTVTNFVASNISAGTLALTSAILPFLYVSNHATIANASIDVSTIGNLYVTASSTLHQFVTAGALAVTGESILRGAVTAGALNVTGDSILQGMVTAGALAVTGESFLRGAVTAGALNVTGDSILQGMVTAGALAVTGESFLRGAVTAGALNVTGDSILQGMVTAGGLAVTGASYFNGDMLITGGNLTVTSGSIVFNTVDVSPSMADIIKERSFTAGNNVISASSITNFAFSGSVARAFDAVVSVTILTTGDAANKYAYYNLKGVQKLGSWTLNSSFVGDVTGVTFYIDSSGQIQYTSTNIADFVSNTIKFRALTTSV